MKIETFKVFYKMPPEWRIKIGFVDLTESSILSKVEIWRKLVEAVKRKYGNEVVLVRAEKLIGEGILM